MKGFEEALRDGRSYKDVMGVASKKDNNINKKENGLHKPQLPNLIIVQGELCTKNLERLERCLITEVFNPISLEEVKSKIKQVTKKTAILLTMDMTPYATWSIII